MAVEGPGREKLRILAARLKDAGDEGRGLRRELLRQLAAAGEPVARKIADPEHLKPYMPDRYAEVLAGDLNVRVQRLLSGKSPRVSIEARGRVHKRKLQLLEDGMIVHPIFAQGGRRSWDWIKEPQTGGMRPGFFFDPCDAAAPDIRDHVLMALDETARKITS